MNTLPLHLCCDALRLLLGGNALLLLLRSDALLLLFGCNKHLFLLQLKTRGFFGRSDVSRLFLCCCLFFSYLLLLLSSLPLLHGSLCRSGALSPLGFLNEATDLTVFDGDSLIDCGRLGGGTGLLSPRELKLFGEVL